MEILNPEDENFSIEKMNVFFDEFKSYDLISDERLDLSIEDMNKCLKNGDFIRAQNNFIRYDYIEKAEKNAFVGEPCTTQYGIKYIDIINNAEKRDADMWQEAHNAIEYIEMQKEEQVKKENKDKIEFDEIDEIIAINEKKIEKNSRIIEEKQEIVNKLKLKGKLAEQESTLSAQEQEIVDLDNQINNLKQNQK